MSTTHTRIGPADQGRKMTLEEFQEADQAPATCTKWLGEFWK